MAAREIWKCGPEGAVVISSNHGDGDKRVREGGELIGALIGVVSFLLFVGLVRFGGPAPVQDAVWMLDVGAVTMGVAAAMALCRCRWVWCGWVALVAIVVGLGGAYNVGEGRSKYAVGRWGRRGCGEVRRELEAAVELHRSQFPGKQLGEWPRAIEELRSEGTLAELGESHVTPVATMELLCAWVSLRLGRGGGSAEREWRTFRLKDGHVVCMVHDGEAGTR